METDARNYELTYLMSPLLSEEEALACANKISSLVEGAKGAIKFAEVPKKIKLAFLVKKEKFAYFGWIDFLAQADCMPFLQKGLKEENRLLRTMIVEKEAKEIQMRPLVKIRTEEEPKAGEEKETGAEEKLDLEALDKKLEEILGR